MREPHPLASPTGRVLITSVAGLVLVFLLAPVVIVVVVSFSASEYLQFPPPAFSFRWYGRLVSVAGWRESVLVSVKLAVLTAAIATPAGVAAAVALTRVNFKGKGAVYALLLSPMIVPTIVTAVGFYFLAARLKLVGSLVGMALGEAVLALPIVLVIASATLQGIDVRLEHAALSLGASPWYAFRRVTLPLIAPGVISAALFAFLSAFDALLIPLFLSGLRLQTLTVRIWNSLQVELDTTIAAVSTMLIAMTTLILTVMALLAWRDTVRR